MLNLLIFPPSSLSMVTYVVVRVSMTPAIVRTPLPCVGQQWVSGVDTGGAVPGVPGVAPPTDGSVQNAIPSPHTIHRRQLVCNYMQQPGLFKFAAAAKTSPPVLSPLSPLLGDRRDKL